MEESRALAPDVLSGTQIPSVDKAVDQKMSKNPGKIAMGVFGVAVVGGVIYAGMKLGSDLAQTHYSSAWPYVLLGLALLIALGFEFVNGFHDTANAVATVIYTHSLDPHVAVVWSGVWNLTGVHGFQRNGCVRRRITAAGGTDSARRVWRRLCDGLRVADRGHCLEPWNMVAGLACFQFAHIDWLHHRRGHWRTSGCTDPHRDVSGVDWSQAVSVFKALLFSPIVGFILSAILLLLCKVLIKDKRLYEAPVGTEPPPFYIRALLV